MRLRAGRRREERASSSRVAPPPLRVLDKAHLSLAGQIMRRSGRRAFGSISELEVAQDSFDDTRRIDQAYDLELGGPQREQIYGSARRAFGVRAGRGRRNREAHGRAGPERTRAVPSMKALVLLLPGSWPSL